MLGEYLNKFIIAYLDNIIAYLDNIIAYLDNIIIYFNGKEEHF